MADEMAVTPAGLRKVAQELSDRSDDANEVKNLALQNADFNGAPWGGDELGDTIRRGTRRIQGPGQIYDGHPPKPLGCFGFLFRRIEHRGRHHGRTFLGVVGVLCSNLLIHGAVGL